MTKVAQLAVLLSVLLLFANCVAPQTANAQAWNAQVPGVPSYTPSQNSNKPSKQPPPSSRSVRTKRSMSSTPVASPLRGTVNRVPSLGETVVDFRAMNYGSPAPVVLRPNPIALSPLSESDHNAAENHSSSSSVDDEQSESSQPQQQTESNEPTTQPLITTALPREMHVPLYVPVGPATGRSTGFVEPDQAPQPAMPKIAKLKPFPPRPTWDPTTVTSSDKYEYWHPGMAPGTRHLPGAGGMAIRLYDRYHFGGYGRTDVDFLKYEEGEGVSSAEIRFLLQRERVGL